MDKIKIGGIYNIKKEDMHIRVLYYDKYGVFYDAYTGNGKWMFDESSEYFKRKCFYYGMPTKIFLENSKFERMWELSENEYKVYRPDLPLFFLRKNNIIGDILANYEAEELDETINIEQIYLYPLTPKNGIKAGILIKANEQQKLTKREILLKAFEAKQALFGEVKEIGIYRKGAQRGIPSFYIGDYYDHGALFEYYETGTVKV